MKQPRLLLLASLSGLALAATPLSAEVLVEYKFDDNSTVYDPNVIASNVSAGDFTPGPGAGSQMNTTSGLNVSGRSLYINNASFNQTSEGGAKSNNDHLSFEVTIAPGFRVDLTSLDFFTLRQTAGGGGAPSGFSVYSSADTFATQLGSGVINDVGDTTFTPQSVDLSALPDLSGTIEFRIVFWAGDGLGSGPNDREWRLDEVSLNGTVEAGSAVGTLVEYKFDDNGTVYDPSGVASNVSAGDFTPGPGITGTNMDSTSALNVSGRSLYINNASFNSTSETSAISANDYLSIEITVDPGFQVDLSSLGFFTLRTTSTGSGAPSGFSVYSSADGFTAQLGSGVIDAVGDNTFTAQSVDLSSLQDLTGTTEFRIIFWAGDGLATPTEREWRLDEVSLTGAVEPIPEPSGDILLAIAPNASTAGNFDFSWNSQPSGKVYDLVSATSFATAPATWPVWDSREDLPSDGTTTNLTNVPGGGDPVRFFAVIEKNAQ